MAGGRILSVTTASPLTPTLSPSAGAREDRRQYVGFPLAPAKGERVGVRGGNWWWCRDTPVAGQSCSARVADLEFAAFHLQLRSAACWSSTDQQVAHSIFPLLHSAFCICSRVAFGWPLGGLRGSLGVALVKPWGSLGVALGCLSVGYQQALGWPWGGLGVACT